MGIDGRQGLVAFPTDRDTKRRDSEIVPVSGGSRPSYVHTCTLYSQRPSCNHVSDTSTSSTRVVQVVTDAVQPWHLRLRIGQYRAEIPTHACHCQPASSRKEMNTPGYPGTGYPGRNCHQWLLLRYVDVPQVDFKL
eukprot:2800367-Rhodomonas_salina.1